MKRARKIRYAVVGLGHITQVAILPAFKHANRNSELTALVSGDEKKLKVLSKKYGGIRTYTYAQYEACLRSGDIDAVYIALPNTMHVDYAVQAAEAGIHVLCEKPMAMTAYGCNEMIEAAAQKKTQLMIAYRLHFEQATLNALKVVRSGRLGQLRILSSTFSTQVNDPDNIRLRREVGGGVLNDIGIYCINAARMLYEAEPIAVQGCFIQGTDFKRFSEVPEMVSATLHFPDERLATFSCSFAAAGTSMLQLLGTKGVLTMSPAFTYTEPITQRLTINEKATVKTFRRRDQFAPELLHFSDCILKGTSPEPSGKEGLADVRIIEAITASAEANGGLVALEQQTADKAPSAKQELFRPPVKMPKVFHTVSPH